MNTMLLLAAMLLTPEFVLSSHSMVTVQEKKSTTDNEIIVEKFGFRISRPDDSWAFQSSEPQPGSLMLKVSRKDTGGKVEATVLAKPMSASGDQAIDQRNAAFERTAASDDFSKRSKIELEIDGKEAPGIEIDWRIRGETYRVQQCYVVHQDFVYTIAIHSPADDFGVHTETLSDIRNSLKFMPVDSKARRTSTLTQLAARCGSEVTWAKSWREASEKARQENKSILVLVRAQGGFDLADGVTTVALMDQDIIDFLNEHCVVLRYQRGKPAPITSYDKYGIGPNSFGSTVLLVDPDGTVFGDTFTFEPLTFYDFLLTSFAGRFEGATPPADLEGPAQVANWFVTRGDFSSALRHLEGRETLEAHQMRASIFRRQRKAKAAVEQLRLARGKTRDAKLKMGLMFDETILRLATGETTAHQAIDVCEDLLQKHPQHSRAAEVAYYLGLCQFAAQRKPAAEKTWLELIESVDHTNRWTWSAAAALTSTTFRMNLPPSFHWPEENIIRAFRSIPFEQLDPAQLDLAEKEAIEYLLATQRDDGAWISPAEALNAKAYSTSPFAIAITSICAKALLPHRGDPEIADRIDRAVAFLVQSNRDAKTQKRRPFYMDYSPWADAYLLRFLSCYAAIDTERKKQVAPLVRDAVDALSKKQKPGGGWSYYITHNLAQADQPSNQSISFMTAAVTIALWETREAGFDVPETVTDRALDCLDRMRNTNQTFTYFLWHDRENEGRLAGEEGASGRGPLCSLALLLAGRGSKKEVGACLDLFLKYRHLYARERGKSLMHAAPGGQGSHYLMFDYVWAAAAAAQLPADQKKRYRDLLLELILSSRSEQGCYLDNPINGWHYGTGMALEAMSLLR